MAFLRRLPVRFDDVDYARIVYFPRFFGYCHQVFEDFFGAEAGIPYAQLLGVRGIGMPSVHAEADFRAPLRFGDTCRVELNTERVGRTSITCRYELFREHENVHAATVRLVTVSTDLASGKPEPVPAEIRAAFERFVAL